MGSRAVHHSTLHDIPLFLPIERVQVGRDRRSAFTERIPIAVELALWIGSLGIVLGEGEVPIGGECAFQLGWWSVAQFMYPFSVPSDLGWFP